MHQEHLFNLQAEPEEIFNFKSLFSYLFYENNDARRNQKQQEDILKVYLINFLSSISFFLNNKKNKLLGLIKEKSFELFKDVLKGKLLLNLKLHCLENGISKMKMYGD